MSADPKSGKNTVKLSSFVALLGSSHVKAACRMLLKLTPGGNFVIASLPSSGSDVDVELVLIVQEVKFKKMRQKMNLSHLLHSTTIFRRSQIICGFICQRIHKKCFKYV